MSSQFDEEWKTRALAALSEIAPALLAEEARLKKIIRDYGRTSQAGEVRAVMRQMRSSFDLDAFIDAPALDGVLRSPSPSPPPPRLRKKQRQQYRQQQQQQQQQQRRRRRRLLPLFWCPVPYATATPPFIFPALPSPPAPSLPPAVPSLQQTSTIATAAAADDDDAPAPTRRRAPAPAKRKAVAVEKANASDGPTAPKRQRQEETVRDAPLKKPITEAIRGQATLPNSTTVLSNRNKESKALQWRFVCDVKNCDVHRSTPGDFHAHMKNKHQRTNGFSIKRACPPAELYWIAEDEAGKVYSGEIFQLDKSRK
ncbi:hypothetical protein LTS17_005400 [Exophiala oligosperma]